MRGKATCRSSAARYCGLAIWRTGFPRASPRSRGLARGLLREPMQWATEGKTRRARGVDLLPATPARHLANRLAPGDADLPWATRCRPTISAFTNYVVGHP